MQLKIEGRNAVLEALNSDRKIYKIFLARGAERKGIISDILRLAGEKKIEVREVEKRELDGISKAHQGVVAFSEERTYVSIEDILKIAERRGEAPFIAVLDGIEDPQNFGAILRTAECAGVHGVIIPERGAAGVTPGVAKASAGAVEHVPVARVSSLASAIELLKKKEIWVAGADMNADKIYYEANLNRPIAIVVGGEDKGLGHLVKERCDFLVKIPLKGKMKSLNASVAFALIAYERVKQGSK